MPYRHTIYILCLSDTATLKYDFIVHRLLHKARAGNPNACYVALKYNPAIGFTATQGNFLKLVNKGSTRIYFIGHGATDNDHIVTQDDLLAIHYTTLAKHLSRYLGRLSHDKAVTISFITCQTATSKQNGWLSFPIKFQQVLRHYGVFSIVKARTTDIIVGSDGRKYSVSGSSAALKAINSKLSQIPSLARCLNDRALLIERNIKNKRLLKAHSDRYYKHSDCYLPTVLQATKKLQSNIAITNKNIALSRRRINEISRPLIDRHMSPYEMKHHAKFIKDLESCLKVELFFANSKTFSNMSNKKPASKLIFYFDQRGVQQIRDAYPSHSPTQKGYARLIGHFSPVISNEWLPPTAAHSLTPSTPSSAQITIFSNRRVGP